MKSTAYKEIVFAFKSSGVMSEALFGMIVSNTAEELRALQTNGKVKNASDDVLRTIVAVKILNDHYQETSALWKLVEKKAFDYCRKQLKMSEAVVRKMLDEVVTSFDKNPLACRKV